MAIAIYIYIYIYFGLSFLFCQISYLDEDGGEDGRMR